MQTEYDNYKLIYLFPQLYVKDMFPQLYVRESVYVFGVTTLPLSMIVLLNFGTVPIVLHFLLLFLFHFITDLLPPITHF